MLSDTSSEGALSGCGWIISLHTISGAKLCHVNGGELEQIQFLLGHVSVPHDRAILGCKRTR